MSTEIGGSPLTDAHSFVLTALEVQRPVVEAELPTAPMPELPPDVEKSTSPPGLVPIWGITRAPLNDSVTVTIGTASERVADGHQCRGTSTTTAAVARHDPEAATVRTIGRGGDRPPHRRATQIDVAITCIQDQLHATAPATLDDGIVLDRSSRSPLIRE